MFTQTSFSNPTFIRRIRRALWLAKLQSLASGKRSTEYVVNRNKRTVLRLDVKNASLVAAYASGTGSRDYTSIILNALEA
jgi:hypothetical protein